MRMRNRGIGQVTPNGATVIANTIQGVEGYSPGTPAYINNNPGNLMYIPSSSIQTSNGATQGTAMGSTGAFFAAFPTYQDGYNALLAQIQNYAGRGLTIQGMMELYVPPVDSNGNPIPGNNPTLYANKIASALGVSPDTTVAAAIGTDSNSGSDNGVSTLSIDPTTGLMTIDDSGDSTGTGAGTSVGTGTGIDPTTALVAGALILTALYLT